MRIRLACLAGLLCLASPVLGDKVDAPLSAIDWLTQNPPVVRPAAQARRPAAPAVAEPPTARSGQAPEVTVLPLGAVVNRRLGLLPQSVTGFAPDLWQGADPDAVLRILPEVLVQRLPAGQDLLLTLLLAEADDPPGRAAADRWLGARLEALLELGAVDPALALVMQADPRGTPALFEHWMTASLLARREVVPCRLLAQTPSLHSEEAVRIFCRAQSGDFETAALLFGTAGALDMLSDVEEALLARFLDPDLFADAPMPRVPLRPSPLVFRLFEAAGAPLPTAPLPRAFAHSDLSEDAGWKAQLEAAERLARAGVLPANQLLGLYSNRKPAASGGIWDRVAGLRRLDQALQQQDSKAVAQTLPATWRGMRAAELEVVFADLVSKPLREVPLTGPAARLAFRLSVLARGADALPPLPEGDTGAAFLASIAQAAPDASLAPSESARAIVAALTQPTPALFASHERGEASLRALSRLSDAGRGDAAALETALIELRRLGLEDVARAAALQVLILRQEV